MVVQVIPLLLFLLRLPSDRAQATTCVDDDLDLSLSFWSNESTGTFYSCSQMLSSCGGTTSQCCSSAPAFAELCPATCDICYLQAACSPVEPYGYCANGQVCNQGVCDEEFVYLFDGCPRNLNEQLPKGIQRHDGEKTAQQCKDLCVDDCQGFETNACVADMECYGDCWTFTEHPNNIKNGECVTDGSQKTYVKTASTLKALCTTDSDCPSGSCAPYGFCQGVLHEGEDCWWACGEKGGNCSWCGTGVCCHSSGNFAGDGAVCNGVTHTYGDFHACASPACSVYTSSSACPSGECIWTGSVCTTPTVAPTYRYRQCYDDDAGLSNLLGGNGTSASYSCSQALSGCGGTTSMCCSMAPSLAEFCPSTCGTCKDQGYYFVENFDEMPLGPFVSPSEKLGDGTDWTSVAPEGWQRIAKPGHGAVNADSSAVAEFDGWTFLDVKSWQRSAEMQEREKFKKGTGVVAVADSDEFDDMGGAIFNARLVSPAIDIMGAEANELRVRYDSSWRREGASKGSLSVSYDGGYPMTLVVLDYAKLDATDESVDVELNNPEGAQYMRLIWEYEGKNNWWWAIDNIAVMMQIAPTPAPTKTPAPPTFNAFIDIDKTVYGSGEPVMVTFADGQGNPEDFIGIYVFDRTPGIYPATDWAFVGGGKTPGEGPTMGTVTFADGLPVGQYIAWLFVKAGDYHEAAQSIVISVEARSPAPAPRRSRKRRKRRTTRKRKQRKTKTKR